MNGQLNAKNDVHSFCVVLLVLLAGRKTIDHTLPFGQQSLVTWLHQDLVSIKSGSVLIPDLEENNHPKLLPRQILLYHQGLNLDSRASFPATLTITTARYIVSEFEMHRLKLFKMEDASMGMWVDQFNSTKQVHYFHSFKFCQFGCVED
ncbi:hypothetical protein RIF29_05812 [Crotalaria pallida]|uniref:Hexosyltransferase n=1 Tax=Crotalaria pallida TaxID=3830 RepID=A0AAN9P9Z4_CROPI